MLPTHLRQWSQHSPQRPSPRQPRDYKPAFASSFLDDSWRSAWARSGHTGHQQPILRASRATSTSHASSSVQQQQQQQTQQPALVPQMRTPPMMRSKPQVAWQGQGHEGHEGQEEPERQQQRSPTTPSSIIEAHLSRCFRTGFDPSPHAAAARRLTAAAAMQSRGRSSYMDARGFYAPQMAGGTK